MANGFKVFAQNEVLTAADVNDLLMEQSICVFADASARDNNSAGFGQMASAQHDGLCAYIEDVDEFQVRINGTWQRMGTKAEVDAASAEVALLNLYMEVL